MNDSEHSSGNILSGRDRLDGSLGYVGDGLSASAAGWTFGGDVYQTFDEHIRRSVPSYAEGHELVLALSDFFVRPAGVVYELGSATGVLTSRIASRHHGKARRVVGVEIEPAMVAEAARRHQGTPAAEFVQADILDYPYEACDFAVSYYTLQFVRPGDRLRAMRAVHDALSPGGAFVLFEKVREPGGVLQDLIGQLYADHKLRHGFAPEEIIAKVRSLRSVLEPATSEENLSALEAVGFSSVGLVQKILSFEGYLAIK